MDVEIKIVDGPTLIKELRAFSEDLAIKTTKTSIRRIGAMLLKRVKDSAPVVTGNLFRNLGVRAKYIKQRGVVVAKVVVNTRGKRSDPKNAFYWRFVEYGHQTRTTGKVSTSKRKENQVNAAAARAAGNSGGQVAPNPFIRSAFQSAQAQIQEMFYQDLQKSIERAKARNSKKV